MHRLLEDAPEFGVGRAAAEAEIEAGRLGYRLLGKIDWQMCDDVRSELLKSFGVELHIHGNCITSISETADTEGYNRRMQEEFVSRFGQDVVALVIRDVERKRKKPK